MPITHEPESTKSGTRVKRNEIYFLTHISTKCMSFRLIISAKKFVFHRGKNITRSATESRSVAVALNGFDRAVEDNAIILNLWIIRTSGQTQFIYGTGNRVQHVILS